MAAAAAALAQPLAQEVPAVGGPQAQQLALLALLTLAVVVEVVGPQQQDQAEVASSSFDTQSNFRKVHHGF
jgi:hypothetical protein